MYKIKIKKTGIGYQVVLMNRFCFMWFPNTYVYISSEHSWRAVDQIHVWMKMFNIPLTRVENINLL